MEADGMRIFYTLFLFDVDHLLSEQIVMNIDRKESHLC